MSEARFFIGADSTAGAALRKGEAIIPLELNHRVGCGRDPVMSNIAVAFIDTRPNGFPGMERYYQLAKMVRMTPKHQDLYIERVVPLPNMCLTELASAMLQNLKEGWSALVYTHGEPDNILFPIDYESSRKNYLDVRDAARLSYHLDLIQAGPLHKDYGQRIVDPFLASKYPGYVDPFDETRKHYYADRTPDYLKISDKVFADRLIDNLVAIRKLRMPHLAIRACRVGMNKELMKYTAMMFGAKSVSAPVAKTASVVGETAGSFRFIKNPEDLVQALKAEKHGVRGVHVYEYPNMMPGTAGKYPWQVTFTIQRQGRARFNLINRIATNIDALTQFLWKTAGYDALISTLLAGGVLALHALDGGTRLIFPGEKDYLANMNFLTV